MILSDPVNITNLDAQEPDWLMCYWQRYQAGRNYREIFPTGGRNTKRAVADLANYASNKATAMRCRLNGDIETARMYEGICDSIYNRLIVKIPLW